MRKQSHDESMPTRPPTPTCKAMLLCDTTIVEAVTGKVSIIGAFSEFNPKSHPIRLPPFQVFLQVSNAMGEYNFKVEIQDLKDQTVVARGTGPAMQILDRLMNSNIILPIPGMQIPTATVFDIVIFANDDEIGRQKVRVMEVPDDDN